MQRRLARAVECVRQMRGVSPAVLRLRPPDPLPSEWERGQYISKRRSSARIAVRLQRRVRYTNRAAAPARATAAPEAAARGPTRRSRGARVVRAAPDAPSPAPARRRPCPPSQPPARPVSPASPHKFLRDAAPPPCAGRPGLEARRETRARQGGPSSCTTARRPSPARRSGRCRAPHWCDGDARAREARISARNARTPAPDGSTRASEGRKHSRGRRTRARQRGNRSRDRSERTGGR
jgi:hypothetical protein